MKTAEGNVAPEVTLLESEQEQVAEAMDSDGPNGALIILMAHRDGRITLRSTYDPQNTSAWLYELALTIVQQYPDNKWPGNAAVPTAAPAEAEEQN